MSESVRIADELRLAFDGEAWHGPALLEILGDVGAETAAVRPLPNAHSIWELTLHIAAWEKVMLRRMAGETHAPSDKENFPVISDETESAWKAAIQLLKDTHREFVREVQGTPESRLIEIVPGKNYDFCFMLHGAAQHIAYHGGQIALLKKIALTQR